jgi:hypothetical protein
MILSGFAGGVFLLILPFAPFDIGSYSIDGETVSGPEFLRREGIVLGGVGALLIAITYTIATREPLARELMILFWMLSAALGTLVPILRGETDFDLTWVPALGIAIWYLYFKPNVVLYFAAPRAA